MRRPGCFTSFYFVNSQYHFFTDTRMRYLYRRSLKATTTTTIASKSNYKIPDYVTMQLLDLPADVFRMVMASTVQQLGLRQSMRMRLTCHTFADEILSAVIATRVIEEVVLHVPKLVKTQHRLDIIARYLNHRVSTEKPIKHPWIAAIRETSCSLAKHTKAGNDAARLEFLEQNVCACLAAQHGSFVFENTGKTVIDPTRYESGIAGNSLTVAAWMGDIDLVNLLRTDPETDPLTFFGRPSWAAATHGHLDIVKFYLEQGALPYEPTNSDGPEFALRRSPLAAAAYMGHADIVQLYLQQEYYRSTDERPDEDLAVYYAAQGNQPTTLRLMLEHVRAKAKPQKFLSMLDFALVCSCTRGAYEAAKLAVEYGADVNETDRRPRSCLQLAAISGNVQIVKMLLDGGADLEAAEFDRQRSSGTKTQMRRQLDALREAKRRNYLTIVRIIEEKKRNAAEKAT